MSNSNPQSSPQSEETLEQKIEELLIDFFNDSLDLRTEWSDVLQEHSQTLLSLFEAYALSCLPEKETIPLSGERSRVITIRNELISQMEQNIKEKK